MSTNSATLRSTITLEKFNKLVSGKKGIPVDIDSKLHASGDFLRLEGIDVIIKGVTNILLTSAGTYLFDPPYGVPLYKYVFEQADEHTRDKILNEVDRQLERYEDRAQITTNAVFLSNKKGFRLDIMIKYKGKQKKIHITIDETYLKSLDEN